MTYNYAQSAIGHHRMIFDTHVTIAEFWLGHTSNIRRIDLNHLVFYGLVIMVAFNSICDPVPPALVICRIQFGII
jgi:hypothetical protein